jgi:hypothetical protein
VALGLLREVVEKSMVNPTQDDLLKLRSEIRQTLISQGADPESIRIQIEVDTKKNLVRCEAQGSMGYSSGSGNTRTHGEAPSREDQIALARQGLGLDAQSEIESSASTSAIDCFRFVASQPKWFGLGRTLTTPVACIDRRGVVLRRFSDVEMLTSRVSTILSDLRAALESRVVYGDGGATYPFATLLVADRVINLSKLVTLENMLLILSQEVAEVPSDEGVVLLLSNTQISDQE